jgi:four helix bundle protein
MPVQNFHDLVAWQRAIDLAVVCYDLTRNFPREERYGITSQIRRAAVSVPSNIAEGNACWMRGRYLYHLGMSRGSLGELETQFVLAERLRFLPARPESFWRMADDVNRLLNGLRRSLL